MKQLFTNSFNKKIINLFALLFTVIFMSGCSNVQKEEVENLQTEIREKINLEQQITPFEKAKELKENYYEYHEIMEKLKKNFLKKIFFWLN